MASIHRIKDIIDHYRLAVSAFEKRIGVSNNSIQVAIKRNASVKDDVLNKVLNSFEQINPLWLLTGKGNMLIGESPKGFVQEPKVEYGKVTPRETLNKLATESDISVRRELINIYEMQLQQLEKELQKEKNEHLITSKKLIRLIERVEEINRR